MKTISTRTKAKKTGVNPDDLTGLSSEEARDYQQWTKSTQKVCGMKGSTFAFSPDDGEDDNLGSYYEGSSMRERLRRSGTTSSGGLGVKDEAVPYSVTEDEEGNQVVLVQGTKGGRPKRLVGEKARAFLANLRYGPAEYANEPQGGYAYESLPEEGGEVEESEGFTDDEEEKGTEAAFDDDDDEQEFAFEDEEETLITGANELEDEQFAHEIGQEMIRSSETFRAAQRQEQLLRENPTLGGEMATAASIRSKIGRKIARGKARVGAKLKQKAGAGMKKIPKTGIPSIDAPLKRKTGQINSLARQAAANQGLIKQLSKEKAKYEGRASAIGEDASDADQIKKAQAEAKARKIGKKIADLREANAQTVAERKRLQEEISELVAQAKEKIDARNTEASAELIEALDGAPMHDFHVAFTSMKPLALGESLSVHTEAEAPLSSDPAEAALQRRTRAEALEFFERMGFSKPAFDKELDGWVPSGTAEEPDFFIQQVTIGEGAHSAGWVTMSEHEGVEDGAAAQITGMKAHVMAKDGLHLKESQNHSFSQHEQGSNYLKGTMKVGDSFFSLTQATAVQEFKPKRSGHGTIEMALFDVEDRHMAPTDPLRKGKALMAYVPGAATPEETEGEAKRDFGVLHFYVNMGPNVASASALQQEKATAAAEEVEEESSDFDEDF